MDRETVITHLQIIHTWAEFARERDLQFFTAKHLDSIVKWVDDALNLLKEKEAVVRCKDCVYWDKVHTEECDNSDSVCFHNGWCKQDWFCADGERREYVKPQAESATDWDGVECE